MLEFLSRAWFEAFRDELEAEWLPAVDFRLRFEVTGAGRRTRWLEAIEGGRIRHWGPGEIGEVDAEIHLRRDDAASLVFQPTLPSGLATRVTVARPVGGVFWEGPSPPLDLGQRPELQQLPHVPGASIRSHWTILGGPFGEVCYRLDFRHGRVACFEAGEHQQPDVALTLSFERLMELHAGRIDVIEAARDGSATASAAELLRLSGLLQSREFRRAERACGGCGRALAGLAELHRSQAWANVRRRLLEHTSVPAAVA